MTPVQVFRLTVHTTSRGKTTQVTKRVSKAIQAADFYALHNNHAWWETIGHTATQNRYQTLDARYDRLHRRALKVFQQYLP